MKDVDEANKKVEIAVTKIINGELIENKDALANPSSLEQYKKFATQKKKQGNLLPPISINI